MMDPILTVNHVITSVQLVQHLNLTVKHVLIQIDQRKIVLEFVLVIQDGLTKVVLIKYVVNVIIDVVLVQLLLLSVIPVLVPKEIRIIPIVLVNLGIMMIIQVLIA